MDQASGLIPAVSHICKYEYVTFVSISLFKRGRDGRGGVLQPRADRKGFASATHPLIFVLPP